MLKRIKSALKGHPPEPPCNCEDDAKDADRAEVEQTITAQEHRLRELMLRLDADFRVGTDTLEPHKP